MTGEGSSNTRQRTITEMQMDMNIQLEKLEFMGKNRQELGLLHAPNTHKYLHEIQMLQEILRTGKYRVEFIHMFDKETLEPKEYMVLLDPDGRILANKDNTLLGIKKNTPLDALLESFFFRQELSSLSYIESNAILRHLPAIEIIVALTLRMAAEGRAQKDFMSDVKSRMPKKEKKGK